MKGLVLEGTRITYELSPAAERLFTPALIQFLAKLHREFNGDRIDLLKSRREKQQKIDEGELPQFLKSTAEIRRDLNWQGASIPKDLERRWVEITGPTDAKMVINALNSGANVFMADFEDANSPTWDRMVEGQLNLGKAIDRTLQFTSPEGKKYTLKDQIATLMVRPRGWHLIEKHFLIEGEPISASLFDFGIYFFCQAQKLIQKGSGPYFYLPKLESYLEARLWNDVFVFAQNALSIPRGTIRATVLIETILAAFEMEEILYELKEHSAGLNAGRWDYIFSIIKKFRNNSSFLFPDRPQITMTVPFMRVYTELLIQTCHKRGVHAMGGMAAFIPNRKEEAVNKNALDKVREDKLREVADGFDGTWVAHPDLVPLASEIFSSALGGKPNQITLQKRNDVEVTAQDLLNFQVPGSKITESGVRLNIHVALRYMESWLNGIGAAAIFNLMEDAATAEICRSQLWQWIHHPRTQLEDGTKVDAAYYSKIRDEEVSKLKDLPKIESAKKLLDMLVLNPNFPEFLTTLAHDFLE